jgi:lysyl-tRNA synthetase class II
MKAEEFKPLRNNKTLSTLSNQEFNLLITSKDPAAVKWRKLHKEEFKLRLRASDLLNDFFDRNTKS